jgi:hypothetical protein
MSPASGGKDRFSGLSTRKASIKVLGWQGNDSSRELHRYGGFILPL